MRAIVVLVILAFLSLVTAACGGDAQPATAPESTVNQAVQATLTALAAIAPLPTDAPTSTPSPVPPTATPTQVPPTDTSTPKSTNTPRPTNTPIPTNTPETVYTGPLVIAEIEGVGSKVTDNLELPKCRKAVFYWTSFPGDSGTATFELNLHNVSAGLDTSLVYEFAADVSGNGISGAVLQGLLGGEYYLTTESTQEPWNLRVECQDGAAPVASGLDLQGTGDTVTENYELPACNKSVFVWSTEPGSYGIAALDADICTVGDDECRSIVGEADTSLTAPLEGEALESLSGGVYFLAISNTSGRPWSIRWECRD